jgi:SAM-dependent methyltransferase
MRCRHCGAELALILVDLGSAPPSNAYITDDSLGSPEKWFPLRVLVCEKCWLVQTEDFANADELFGPDYAYFSSFSTSWLTHSEQYVADMVNNYRLDTTSRVVEVASNDGYLLQYVKARHIPCFGIEPTAGTAAAARAKGIEIVEDFFGTRVAKRLAAKGDQADLMVANNVLAHVPDINDFVAGFPVLLKPEGVATFEFPHLLRLISENQFDTIYHEHYSYLSLSVVNRILEANGLSVFDVQEQRTHGGSLRVFAQRRDTGQRPQSAQVGAFLDSEARAGVLTGAYYAGFQARTDNIKNEFLAFLLESKRRGKMVAAYGAAAKGNTLMNYAGIRRDLIALVADANPSKQGRYMPGSRIPIVDESALRLRKPDFVVILPWNLKQEIMHQLDYIKKWDGKFVTAIPRLEII